MLAFSQLRGEGLPSPGGQGGSPPAGEWPLGPGRDAGGRSIHAPWGALLAPGLRY